MMRKLKSLFHKPEKSSEKLAAPVSADYPEVKLAGVINQNQRTSEEKSYENVDEFMDVDKQNDESESISQSGDQFEDEQVARPSHDFLTHPPEGLGIRSYDVNNSASSRAFSQSKRILEILANIETAKPVTANSTFGVQRSEAARNKELIKHLDTNHETVAGDRTTSKKNDEIKFFAFGLDENDEGFLIQAKDDIGVDCVQVPECAGPFAIGNIEVEMMKSNGLINIWRKTNSNDNKDPLLPERDDEGESNDGEFTDSKSCQSAEMPNPCFCNSKENPNFSRGKRNMSNDSSGLIQTEDKRAWLAVKMAKQASSTIHISNVPHAGSKKKLKKDLKKIFDKCGPIEGVRLTKVPVDGSISVYIVYKSEDAIDKALDLNGHQFKENFLRVERMGVERELDPKRTVFLQNLSHDVTENELWEKFSVHGTVECVKIIRIKTTRGRKQIDKKTTQLGMSAAFIQFKDADGATAALAPENSKTMGRRVRVKAYDPKKKKKKFLEDSQRQHGHGEKVQKGSSRLQRHEDDASLKNPEDSSNPFIQSDVQNGDAPSPQLTSSEFHLPESQEKQSNDERIVQEENKIVQALNDFRSQLHDEPDKDVKIQGPSELKVRLLDHQQHALAWMLWRERCEPAGGILADDMGLGKTVTTIALIMKSLADDSRHTSVDFRINPGGTLIVCPAHLIPQWQQEILTKGKISEVVVYRNEEESDCSVLAQYQVVISSYEALAYSSQHHKIIHRMHWRRVILDEAHCIRDSNAGKSKYVRDLVGDKRWALTGAPINNHIKDIFPILRFLQLKPFDDIRIFNKWIANNDAAGIARLHGLMECIMLRRTKNALAGDGLMPELPRKNHRVIGIDLATDERIVYDRVMTYSRTLCGEFLHQGTDDYLKSSLTQAQMEFLARQGNVASHHVLTLLLRLRQICCHPALIKDMLGKEDFQGAGVDNPAASVLDQANKELFGDLVEFHGYGEAGQEREDTHVLTRDNPVFNENFVSSKLKAIIELVQEIIQKEEKVIIFSDWVKYLNIIGQQLGKIPGATHEFYIGIANHEERARIAQHFNHSEHTRILLVSLKAIGQGLDLKRANHVIIADIHWNPQMEIYAQDLVYRIGQTRDVFVHKFVCKDTIEESIVGLQGKKLMIAGVVLLGSGHGVRELNQSEMGALFNL